MARSRKTRRHVADTGGKGEAAPGLSAALIEELTAHRTAALQARLADNPKVALAAVVHALALDVFYVAARTGSVVRIAPSAACLDRSAEGIEESKARTQLAATTKAVRKRLPKDPDKLWGWLIDRDQPQRIDQELASGQNHVILFLRGGLRLAEGAIEE
jgi:ParB family transcriptional regulator, chromosome partitioning protein